MLHATTTIRTATRATPTSTIVQQCNSATLNSATSNDATLNSATINSAILK